MSSQAKIAKNLLAFKIAVNAHDRENDCTANGIGLAWFDLDRLGFDEGEELWPGITVRVDGKASGNFRVLCDGMHDNDREAEAEERLEIAHAVGVEA